MGRQRERRPWSSTALGVHPSSVCSGATRTAYAWGNTSLGTGVHRPELGS